MQAHFLPMSLLLTGGYPHVHLLRTRRLPRTDRGPRRLLLTNLPCRRICSGLCEHQTAHSHSACMSPQPSHACRRNNNSPRWTTATMRNFTTVLLPDSLDILLCCVEGAVRRLRVKEEGPLSMPADLLPLHVPNPDHISRLKGALDSVFKVTIFV